MPNTPYNDLGHAHALASMSVPAKALREVNLSFARNGEDLLFRGAFKMKLRTRQPGFYVDVGCYHPVNISNTYLFYCYGWNGVCIDANQEVADQFKQWRPRDRIVVTAIAGEEKSVFYAAHKKYDALNKISDRATDFGSDFSDSNTVQARPLSAVLDDHVPEGTQIDFFSIDIEDSELGALESNNWRKYRPHAIIVEDYSLNTLDVSKSSTAAYLLDLGYRVSNAGTDNIFFIDADFDEVKRKWAQLVLGASE